jgi:hypothetical protein
MAEINVHGFSGSNNVKTEEKFFSKKGVCEPRVILNADIDLTGRVVKRQGKDLAITLSGAHSLWAGNTCMLCAANGVLYRISQGKAVNLGTISGVKYPLSYVEAEDKVYISNPYWQGVLDPSSNTVSSWGVAVPPGPMLLSSAGNLPAGTYYVCMTNVVNGELSGNSPITQFQLSAEGGIQVLNRPTGALVWITDTNEGIFYLVGAQNQIVTLPTVEPLPSFMCSPPPFLTNLCYAFGRIWGSSGCDVYYSQPFKLGWFKLSSNVYHFEDEVTMIAKVPTGLFIGMKNRTRFLLGTIPEQMVQQDAGAGSIQGTLAYCNNLPELGWTLGTPEKDFTDVPVWMTSEGIVVGSPSGKFFNVTKNKLKMGIPEQGASLYRNLEGVIQFLTSFKMGTTGSGAGFSDPDTINAFINGRIDIHNKNLEGMGSGACFSEEVTCTVTRNGQLI